MKNSKFRQVARGALCLSGLAAVGLFSGTSYSINVAGNAGKALKPSNNACFVGYDGNMSVECNTAGSYVSYVVTIPNEFSGTANRTFYANILNDGQAHDVSCYGVVTSWLGSVAVTPTVDSVPQASWQQLTLGTLLVPTSATLQVICNFGRGASGNEGVLRVVVL